MTIENYYVEELLVKVFDRGEQVYFSPDIKEIAAYHKRSSASLWEQYKSDLNPRHNQTFNAINAAGNVMDLDRSMCNMISKLATSTSPYIVPTKE